MPQREKQAVVVPWNLRQGTEWFPPSEPVLRFTGYLPAMMLVWCAARMCIPLPPFFSLGHPKIVNKGRQTWGLPFLFEQQQLLSLHILSSCILTLDPLCAIQFPLCHTLLKVVISYPDRQQEEEKAARQPLLRDRKRVINKTAHDRHGLGNTDKIKRKRSHSLTAEDTQGPFWNWVKFSTVYHFPYFCHVYKMGTVSILWICCVK